MANYYVNTKPKSGDPHEVHRDDCEELPNNRRFLGAFDSCEPAVKEAKEHYSDADGCWHCSRDCHNR